jgi:hypothetical protein
VRAEAGARFEAGDVDSSGAPDEMRRRSEEELGGIDGGDIALDTTLLIDVDGRERWRRTSQTLPDLPTAEQILARIRDTTAR